MIKALVYINLWYDVSKEQNPRGLAFYIMLLLVAVPIILIVNLDRFPWWVTAGALMVLLASFLMRFIWVVIGEDMINHVKEKNRGSSVDKKLS